LVYFKADYDLNIFLEELRELKKKGVWVGGPWGHDKMLMQYLP
jgi:hypothetical protein